MSTRLQIEDIVIGHGDEAIPGKSLTVHYIGRLADGQIFDSTAQRDGPLWFPLGQGYVIKGWDMGVPGMKVGGKRKLIVPPELGYGDQGYAYVPPGATLIFEIELLQVH